jgi:hypothetical protein
VQLTINQVGYFRKKLQFECMAQIKESNVQIKPLLNATFLKYKLPNCSFSILRNQIKAELSLPFKLLLFLRPVSRINN